MFDKVKDLIDGIDKFRETRQDNQKLKEALRKLEKAKDEISNLGQSLERHLNLKTRQSIFDLLESEKLGFDFNTKQLRQEIVAHLTGEKSDIYDDDSLISGFFNNLFNPHRDIIYRQELQGILDNSNYYRELLELDNNYIIMAKTKDFFALFDRVSNIGDELHTKRLCQISSDSIKKRKALLGKPSLDTWMDALISSLISFFDLINLTRQGKKQELSKKDFAKFRKSSLTSLEAETSSKYKKLRQHFNDMKQEAKNRANKKKRTTTPPTPPPTSPAPGGGGSGGISPISSQLLASFPQPIAHTQKVNKVIPPQYSVSPKPKIGRHHSPKVELPVNDYKQIARLQNNKAFEQKKGLLDRIKPNNPIQPPATKVLPPQYRVNEQKRGVLDPEIVNRYLANREVKPNNRLQIPNINVQSKYSPNSQRYHFNLEQKKEAIIPQIVPRWNKRESSDRRIQLISDEALPKYRLNSRQGVFMNGQEQPLIPRVDLNAIKKQIEILQNQDKKVELKTMRERTDHVSEIRLDDDTQQILDTQLQASIFLNASQFLGM
jgi:hypothetical protein